MKIISGFDRAGFTQWHEDRMSELRYPPEIVDELRAARDKWLASLK